MGQFVVGDIVVVSFPFSDLSGQKMRPALVVAEVEFGDLILCQITSKPYSSKTAFPIQNSDFQKGNLPVISYVRPDKLFTAEASIIQREAGKLKDSVQNTILSQIKDLFTPSH